jgi:hypothetical protein
MCPAIPSALTIGALQAMAYLITAVVLFCGFMLRARA